MCIDGTPSELRVMAWDALRRMMPCMLCLIELLTCLRLQRVLTKQELDYLERAQHRPTAVSQVPAPPAGGSDITLPVLNPAHSPACQALRRFEGHVQVSCRTCEL